MSLPLSQRAQRMGESATFRLARRAQELREQGKDVLGFGLGEPDFDTPEGARTAAKAAIDRGETHYTANEGLLPLREAIAAAARRDLGVQYEPKSEILVTNGSKQAIAQALLALVNDGDEVLVPAPYWVTYPELVRFAGGVPRYVASTAKDGFHLRPAELEAAITPRTRVLILNSPNNPTGAVLSPAALAAIGEIALRHDLAIVSDEIYGELVYGGRRHASIASLSQELRERTIVCSGVSKAYAMTGWRIGFAHGPAAVIGAMNRMQGHLTSNACSISQHAALAALRHCHAAVAPMREAFDERRRLVIEHLGGLPGIHLPEPEGAFYAFPDVSGLYGKQTPAGARLTDSDTFCAALLDEAHVSLMPGSAFGADACVRLSYAAAKPQLQEGCARIARFVRSLA